MNSSATVGDPFLRALGQNRIVAVLVIENAGHAVALAETLIASSIGAMELTLRTPAALEALVRIRSAVPEMIAGVGTILTPEQVTAAVDAGAAFGVAPGLSPRVVEAATRAGLPFAPGICTPSEIELAIEHGCRTVKFFPAEPSGGVAYLRSAAAPYAHLGLRYVPLGGLTANNFTSYLATGVVPAVGGSWIAPREVIAAGDWAAVGENARQAADTLRTFEHRTR